MSNSAWYTPAPHVFSVCENLIKIPLFTVNHHPNMTPGTHLTPKLGLAVAKLALEGRMSISLSENSLRDN